MVIVKVITLDGYNDHNASNVELVEMDQFDKDHVWKWINGDDKDDDNVIVNEARQNTCIKFINKGVITVPFEEGGYVFVNMS